MEDSTDRISNESSNTIPISLDSRYLGAWAEVNARMQSKYNILAMYLIASIGILGFLYNISTQVEKSLMEGRSPSREAEHFWYLANALPFVSVISTLLIFSHNSAIRHLNVIIYNVGNPANFDIGHMNYHLRKGYKLISSRNAENLAIGLVYITFWVCPFLMGVLLTDIKKPAGNPYIDNYFILYAFLCSISLLIIIIHEISRVRDYKKTTIETQSATNMLKLKSWLMRFRRY
jgi:hypothetical protein